MEVILYREQPRGDSSSSKSGLVCVEDSGSVGVGESGGWLSWLGGSGHLELLSGGL